MKVTRHPNPFIAQLDELVWLSEYYGTWISAALESPQLLAARFYAFHYRFVRPEAFEEVFPINWASIAVTFRERTWRNASNNSSLSFADRRNLDDRTERWLADALAWVLYYRSAFVNEPHLSPDVTMDNAEFELHLHEIDLVLIMVDLIVHSADRPNESVALSASARKRELLQFIDAILPPYQSVKERYQHVSDSALDLLPNIDHARERVGLTTLFLHMDNMVKRENRPNSAELRELYVSCYFYLHKPWDVLSTFLTERFVDKSNSTWEAIGRQNGLF